MHGHECGCDHRPTDGLELPVAEATTVTVEAPAQEWVKEQLENEGKADHLIRLKVHRTGCMGGRGHTYSLDLEKAPTDSDKVIESDGLRFVMDLESAKLLADVDVRLQETEGATGLVVANSHAIGTCPCGRHDIFA